jgi:hypothetical protein
MSQTSPKIAAISAIATLAYRLAVVGLLGVLVFRQQATSTDVDRPKTITRGDVGLTAQQYIDIPVVHVLNMPSIKTDTLTGAVQVNVERMPPSMNVPVSR